MNRYRTYMDHIQAPEELRDRILAGERPRRSRPALAVGALAACCLVAAVGGWQLWQGRAETQPDPTAGVAATPAGNQQREYTLVVEDPFEGQPHSFPNIPGYDYPDCTSSDAMAADYAPPDGWFMEVMSAQEIIPPWGAPTRCPGHWTGPALAWTAWRSPPTLYITIAMGTMPRNMCTTPTTLTGRWGSPSPATAGRRRREPG